MGSAAAKQLDLIVKNTSVLRAFAPPVRADQLAEYYKSLSDDTLAVHRRVIREIRRNRREADSNEVEMADLEPEKDAVSLFVPPFSYLAS